MQPKWLCLCLDDDVMWYVRVQNQVSGVISIMKDNITKVIDRGEKLEDLEEKSGDYFAM